MTRDINTATREELLEVPSISPSRAETILSWRDNHGPVSDLNELTEIPGVGEKTVQKMAEYFTASGTDEAEPDADQAEPDEVTASGTTQDEPDEGEGGEGGEDEGEGGEESDEDGEEGDEDGEEDGDEDGEEDGDEDGEDEDGDGEEDDPDEAA